MIQRWVIPASRTGKRPLCYVVPDGLCKWKLPACWHLAPIGPVSSFSSRCLESLNPQLLKVPDRMPFRCFSATYAAQLERETGSNSIIDKRLCLFFFNSRI